MEVIERGRVPIYEVECRECKSKIRYKKSEVHFTGYITCPVCGMELYAGALFPVKDSKEDTNDA